MEFVASPAVRLAAVVALFMAAGPASALSLPAVLSDGAVFQRGKPIRLWGTAKPGEKVTVTWGALTQSVTTSADGQWRVNLPATEQLPGDTIQVNAASGEQRRIRNPLLGQVWICGGQSNMALQLRRTDQAGMAGQALAAPARLRLFRAPTPELRRANQGAWLDDSPATASEFSAVCYLTGRMLAEKAREPVGLIDTAVGATGIEAWVPESAKSSVAAVVTAMGPAPQRHSLAPFGSAFAAVVKPIAPFSARGLLWYQGEADYRRNPGSYADLFVNTMSHWRKNFEQPELQVVYMQLPLFNPPDRGADWEEIRRQQAKAEGMLPGLAMAPSAGIIATEIHPKDKAEVARRMFQRATGSNP